jgi:hypothetical protein
LTGFNSPKLSNDPMFKEKLIDVVGLYLNPPEQAIALCMDEKSSIQALDRTQPSLPMRKGRGARVTHDYYKRRATTTLFAALDAAISQVTGSCLPKHRHIEFLRTVEKNVPAWLQIHLILDNYATHKHANVKAWLAAFQIPPAFHPHVLAEPGGGVVSRTHRQGTTARSVPQRTRDLIYLNAHNDTNPSHCYGPAPAESILQKAARSRITLQTINQN